MPQIHWLREKAGGLVERPGMGRQIFPNPWQREIWLKDWDGIEYIDCNAFARTFGINWRHRD